MGRFEVIFPVELREPVAFDPSFYLREDFSNLGYAIMQLKDIYWGSLWQINLGEKEFQFRIEDMGLIWDDIPALLQKIASSEHQVVWFDMIECETLIVAEPRVEDVLVSIVQEGFWSLYRNQCLLDDVSPERVRVTKQEFFQEWRDFAEAVISLAIEYDLIDQNDESIAEYMNQIP